MSAPPAVTPHRPGRRTEVSPARVRLLRLLLVVVGLTGSAVALQWHAADPQAPEPVAALLLLLALGSAAAAADLPTLALWLAATGLVPALAWLGADAPASRSAGLLLLAGAVGAGTLALRTHGLLGRARRAGVEHDRLVGQLRRQVELVEAANAEKSRFLGAASHDLRQPMHALGLFVTALERELRETRHHAKVVSMAQAVDALEASFSTMLDISRLDAGVVQPHLQAFPIRDVYRRLHLQFAGDADERGLALRFKPGGKTVTSDPQLLERVLGNLLQNALRYTERGGVVVVTRTRARQVAIEVWDTGVGIAADELPRVFQEFYQVGNPGRDRSKGLGMGLSIVQRLVRLLGHELQVRSTPGRGSVFRLLLARTELDEIEGVTLAADTLPFAPDEERTVLVIDDEAAVRAGMHELLAGWGYTVLQAATIDEVRQRVRQHDGVIDVIVSDLRLGGGEDGIAAIAVAREVYGGPLPALLVTGDTSAAEVQRAHDSGHPVLFKPVRSRDLHAALRSTP